MNRVVCQISHIEVPSQVNKCCIYWMGATFISAFLAWAVSTNLDKIDIH